MGFAYNEGSSIKADVAEAGPEVFQFSRRDSWAKTPTTTKAFPNVYFQFSRRDSYTYMNLGELSKLDFQFSRRDSRVSLDVLRALTSA